MTTHAPCGTLRPWDIFAPLPHCPLQRHTDTPAGAVLDQPWLRWAGLALMRLAWFAQLYGRWKPWKDALIAQAKDSPAWRTVAHMTGAVRQWLRQLLQSL